MATDTDRIEKKVFLRAPIERVWRAVSDAREFGSWFGVDFDGPFAPGTRIKGKIVPTKADPEVAKTQKGYEGMAFDFIVDRIEPKHLFSFRWRPFAIDPNVDYSSEPTTLVVFALREVTDGTLLIVTETGFDGVPLARRAKAFQMNEQGWDMQMKLIEKYLAHAA